MSAYWFNILTTGGWNPKRLGSKLRSWVETDGLVTNTTNRYGVVNSSGRITQLTDLTGNGFHWTPSGNSPSLSGGFAQFLKSNTEGMVNTGLFTDSGTNTTGEIIYVGNKTTAESIYGFLASRPADILKRCLFGINDANSDRMLLQIKSTASDINTWNSTDGQQDTGKFIASFRPRTTNYAVVTEKKVGNYGVRIENPSSATNSGALASNAWFGAVSPQNFTMMRLLDSTPIYYTGGIAAVLYCNAVLTDQERSDLFCYLGKYL